MAGSRIEVGRVKDAGGGGGEVGLGKGSVVLLLRKASSSSTAAVSSFLLLLLRGNASSERGDGGCLVGILSGCSECEEVGAIEVALVRKASSSSSASASLLLLLSVGRLLATGGPLVRRHRRNIGEISLTVFRHCLAVLGDCIVRKELHCR